MKQKDPRTLLAATGFTFLSIASTAGADITLFADNFNRPDAFVVNVGGGSTTGDINGTNAGKSGTLGNLTWTGRAFSGDTFGVQGNTLRQLGSGGANINGGLAYINDHNFIDNAIIAGGGFSITVDVVSYATSGSGRYWAVGVGQSLADLDALTADNALQTAAATLPPADLMIGYRNTTDDLEIWNNGVLNASQTVLSGLPNPVTTMRIDFTLSNFNAGSTVNYGVFFDGNATALTSGSFTWGATNQNYIALGSNLTGTSRLDNFAITTPVPEPTSLALLGLGGLLIARRRRD